jgi:hypothetical protein
MLLVSLAAVEARAESSYQPAPANLEARHWFQDAKFGLFIHWGVYSVLGDGEWVMNNRKIAVREYEKLPAFFNPTEYDPAEWVALAKAAGMKYITITSKHHDGFAMFGSKVSNWNIVDRTPYHSPTSATGRASSFSSITRSSTGITRTTTRTAKPGTTRGGRNRVTGPSTSITWTRSCGSS